MATTIEGLHLVPVSDQGGLIDTNKAAALLSVSPSMVAKLRRSGDLETVHVGRAARVRLSDVERIISEGTR
jgi:hypothetical protein